MLIPVGWCVMLGGAGTQSTAVALIGLLIFLAAIAAQFKGTRQLRAVTADVNRVLNDADPEDSAIILEIRDDLRLTQINRSRVDAALITALSRVAPGTSVSFSSFQRETLRWMVVGSNIDMALAIVSAFKYIGNANDCATVGRVVSGASPVQSEMVLQQAREVLPFIEQRLMQARAGRDLLRASSAPDSNTLLRAYLTQDDTAASTLMRPVD